MCFFTTSDHSSARTGGATTWWGGQSQVACNTTATPIGFLFFQIVTMRGVGKSGCTERQLADKGTGTVDERGGGGGPALGLGVHVLYIPL